MKILFITLSNIGDCILTLPVLDVLRENFPQAEVTCLAGPRAAGLFQDNPQVHKTIIYNKYASWRENKQLFRQLKNEHFDLIVDLRNTLFGAFLPAGRKTSPFKILPANIRHMHERHLYKINTLKLNPLGLKSGDSSRAEKAQSHSSHGLEASGDFCEGSKIEQAKRGSLWIGPQDEEYIRRLLNEHDIKDTDKIFVVSCGARSHVKRWSKEKFVELIPLLEREFAARIILVGDKDDAGISNFINDNLSSPVADLTAKTTLTQLAALLKRADLVITNDSAILHLASYLNRPIAAIFGPTSEAKYGPWSDQAIVVKKDLSCRPCEKAQCRFSRLDCVRFIKAYDVLEAVRRLLDPRLTADSLGQNFLRILIARTDRIGDVLLSTPVIKALREAYPSSYIAMLVSPAAKDIVEGNPYLDEVLVYDKDSKHKSWYHSMKFALNLKKKRFDLAVILHPINRVHLLAFFAGIPRRIGYGRKLGFLLTDKVRHEKQNGRKHESDYNFDLLRPLGIEAADKRLFMPIKYESEKWTQDLFTAFGITDSDKLLAIHPAASCPSKVWPEERFAEVAQKLAQKYGFKVLLVAGPKDLQKVNNVLRVIRVPVVDLAGRTSVSQLASVLKRCRLFISNDSGPVHIAAAVGTPVISIFGRSQPGLSPKRWGPLGAKAKVLHKPAGCIECLAHNCQKKFACLRAITVDDVLQAADEILK